MVSNGPQIFLKISSPVFQSRKKVIQIWKNMEGKQTITDVSFLSQTIPLRFTTFQFKLNLEEHCGIETLFASLYQK